MGDGINIAARLQGVAKPGGICISDDAYRQVKSRLDLKVSDLGPVPLKNIAEPMRAYSLEVGAKSVSLAAPKRRWSFFPLAARIAALLILLAGGWYIFNGRAPKPAEAAHLSIVVLPFANLSGDPAQDYLADSLTDELTTALSRIRDSFVIARNTAFTYKGKPVDAKAIGKDLGVRYVLEGSVLPTGNQVRVNAQLIDADSGAHLWADQFDTPRADLLQMQDEIVTRLAYAMNIELAYVEAARFKRTQAANPDAEDLALQCEAGAQKGGLIGEEADAGYRLCEQALDADPNNVRALGWLSRKFLMPVSYGRSADKEGDLKRADALASRALALDSTYATAHSLKAGILYAQGRFDESIAEYERALALDPAMVAALASLGYDYQRQGEFEKSLGYLDKAIRLSPHDPALAIWYNGKALAYFALKQYDQAIEWARRAIATNANISPYPHLKLIAALALIGREGEAHAALQRYLALVPSGPKTIAATEALSPSRANPRDSEFQDRQIEGLRKAGMPEGEQKTN
jgi:TolB-like protein/cytochrome c-type biogenesis protein CcmH/NrfG